MNLLCFLGSHQGETVEILDIDNNGQRCVVEKCTECSKFDPMIIDGKT